MSKWYLPCDRCRRNTQGKCRLCGAALCDRRRCQEVHMSMCAQGTRKKPAEPKLPGL